MVMEVVNIEDKVEDNNSIILGKLILCKNAIKELSR